MVFTSRVSTFLFNSNSYGVYSRSINNVLWKVVPLYIATHSMFVSLLIISFGTSNPPSLSIENPDIDSPFILKSYVILV